ncbi:hypothetical protein GCM10010520_01900 [Rhizobium viscosum]|uniref:Glycosyltransferase family 2 protein n=1 Tax=Rhizobium viscosum TaxID=1673 RepID=A0ABR9IMS3_RHIVS|nr:hypothetical protein [Rhizobium viscosum]MBE1504466.1 hypothetical protein [Rhizobium viscosum]
MKICLLITTHRRDIQLVRLLSQIMDLRSKYTGPAVFETAVTDSELDNAARHILEPLCDLYVTNKGSGFDDNLFHFYADHARNYDFIFSISDDDVFSCGQVNPLDLLELAAKQQHDAVLFNHCEYRSADMLATELTYTLSPSFYTNPKLMDEPEAFRRHFLGCVPRHVGLLYRSSFIIENLGKLAAFRNTLHLYAVPLLLALEKNRAMFFDYPLNYFAADRPRDGAWEDWTNVFMGLYRFLLAAKAILSPASFAITKQGFMANYLNDRSWLRGSLSHSVPSEAQILRELDGTLESLPQA